ncbi:hypothetical protein [Microbulbifer sp. A4B17]|uniref:hypothetical protein n=1 Tax=Microbulbifer sp. A4B17 TaxID=359370 RepID=UPI00192E1F57|nr:hypothetical protein [Microbulbifer sp. A4B17]
MPKDENYIIDLCDSTLELRAKRQHRFDFLRGDTGSKLPVDAYYPEINLVIEYHERQHTEPVAFWDNKQTASGIPRGVQRELYDQRRIEVLPENGIDIIVLKHTDFEHRSNRRLVRTKSDVAVIKSKLGKWLKS